ncbi:hypothetical protein [Coprothermobacter platensis]|uniref:hypothetical protein n=1 Tax=Coprothermobacter platensis TaxID=108819 RepID=UPI000368557B|nr:hypothetical protein [Coprothermobacter platensis]
MKSIKKSWLFVPIIIVVIIILFVEIKSDSTKGKRLSLVDYRSVASMNLSTSEVRWSGNNVFSLSADGKLLYYSANKKNPTILMDNVSMFSANHFGNDTALAVASRSGEVFYLDQGQGFSPKPLVSFKEKAAIISLDLSTDNGVILISLSPFPTLREQNDSSGIYLYSIFSGRLERILPDQARACINADGTRIYYANGNIMSSYDLVNRNVSNIAKQNVDMLSCSKTSPVVAFVSTNNTTMKVSIYDEKTRSTKDIYETDKYEANIRDVWWSTLDDGLYISLWENTSASVKRLEFQRDAQPIPWIKALSLAIHENDDNLVSNLVRGGVSSVCTAQSFPSQRFITRDVDFQTEPVTEKLWSVTMNVTEHIIGQASQCDWSLSFFLDMTSRNFQATNAKAETPKHYFVSEGKLITEMEDTGLVQTTDLQRFFVLGNDHLVSASQYTKPPQTLFFTEDNGELLLSYGVEKGNVVTLDMTPLKRGVIDSLTLPGNVIYMGSLNQQHVVFYKVPKTGINELFIEHNTQVTTQVNTYLKQYQAMGMTTGAPFIINETLFIPLNRAYGDVKLTYYLAVDSASNSVYTVQP